MDRLAVRWLALLVGGEGVVVVVVLVGGRGVLGLAVCWLVGLVGCGGWL